MPQYSMSPFLGFSILFPFYECLCTVVCLLQYAGRRGIQFYSIARRGSVLYPSNDHTWADVDLQPFLQNRDLSPYLQQRLCLPQSLVSLR